MMLCLKLIKNVEGDDAHLAALGSDGVCLTHETPVALHLLEQMEDVYPLRVMCAD